MENKNKLNFSIVDEYKYNPVIASESLNKGTDMVNWGDNNQYPNYLYDLYSNCATLQSIINGSADYTFGDGIDLINLPESFKQINSEGQTIENVIYKLCLDYWIFGGFAFQIIYNTFHQITEIIYLDFRKCRTSYKGEYIYYSDKFGHYGSKTQALKFNKFDPNNLECNTQVYYFKGNKTRGVYPIPDYSAAIVSAETQIEIQNFHYNTIKNNFNANGIISFNNAGNVDQETREKIVDSIIDSFSGSQNAGRFMVTFAEDSEKAPTFTRIADDEFDQKYQSLSTSTRDNLFISMRAIPVLFGQTVQTGFNTQEYKDAFKLYNKTAILPKQKDIERIFSNIFKTKVLTFKPFTIEYEQ